MAERKMVKTTCIGCVWGCGINAYVEDGRLVKVEGMKEHPVSQGYLCPRGEHIIDFIYSPDRLKHPMMKKDDGTWERVSWDTALDFIARKLQEISYKYGPRSMSIFCGSVGAENIEIAAFAHRFSNAYGTPNIITGSSACYRSRIIARNMTFGINPGTYHIEDALNPPEMPKCTIVWGRALDASATFLANRMHQAAADGMRLIVVDPMRTPLAKKGIHLPVRPGADAALALAMLNVIITEGLYDKEFVEKYTHGFDKLAEHVKQYTPEKMEEVTWVPAADIKLAARVFADCKPASIITGTCSIDQHINGLQNNRAVALLMAVTGNVEAPGTWQTVPTLPLFNWRLGVDEKPLGHDIYPLFCLLESQGMLIPNAILEGKPYPIKAMIISAGNPVLTFPDQEKMIEAYKHLELLVVQDLYMTETAELAHVALPASTNFEHIGPGPTYWHSSGLPFFSLTKKLIEPIGESWPDWQFFAELGRKMGYSQHFPWKTSEEVCAKWLENTGLTIEQLTEKEPVGVMYGQKQYYNYKKGKVNTPTGKIELWSEALAKNGYLALPTHVEPSQSPFSSPELAKEFPLVLTTGPRVPQFSHSQMRSVPALRGAYPEPLADINPSTARQYGVENGDMISLETKKGQIKIKAHTTDDLAAGIVSVPHGWARANCNVLTELEPRDPVTGYPEFRALLCRIKKL